MSEFFKTRMGQQFFEGTMPRIAKALEEIAEAARKRDGGRDFCEVEGCEDYVSTLCPRHTLSETDGAVVVDVVYVVHYMPKGGLLVFASAEGAKVQMVKDLTTARGTQLHSQHVQELESWWHIADTRSDERDEWVLAGGQFHVTRAAVQL